MGYVGLGVLCWANLGGSTVIRFKLLLYVFQLDRNLISSSLYRFCLHCNFPFRHQEDQSMQQQKTGGVEGKGGQKIGQTASVPKPKKKLKKTSAEPPGLAGPQSHLAENSAAKPPLPPTSKPASPPPPPPPKRRITATPVNPAGATAIGTAPGAASGLVRCLMHSTVSLGERAF